MYDYKQVESMIAEWTRQGLSKPEIVVNAANAFIGWPYCWGASGKHMCTVANRKKYMNNSKITPGDKELIRKRCQILNGSKSSCANCVYNPNNVGVFLEDCQGFVKLVFSYIGITFTGGGCTSMWNATKNWEERGTIGSMPKDKVCCVFKDVDGTKEHILIYDGQGNYIHDSGEVKKQATSKYKATHWAIPKGLYDKPVPPVPPTPPTPTPGKGEAIVTGKRVAMRLGPTTKAGVIMRVDTGVKVKIETPPDDWQYVDYNGKYGYMMKQYIEIDGDNVKVTGRQVALRLGPTTSAAVMLRIPTGTMLKTAHPPEDWEYISYSGKSGYMMKKFLIEG